MYKLLMMAIVLLSFFLQGCSRNIFTLPVQENEKALVRFNQPKDYEYNPAHYPVTIENINTEGKPQKLTYTKPPTRVISVWQNSIETLIALGVGDRIVAGNGVPSPKYFLPEYQEQYKEIPYTGLQLLDLETSMMLKPDLIVGWHSTFGPKVLRSTNFWNTKGINTYIAKNSVLGKGTRILQNEYDDILNLGKIFDKNERAQEIVGQMQNEIKFATEQTANLPNRPRALIIEYMGKEIRVYGQKTLAGNIVQELKGDLLAPTQTSIGAEQIIDLDPEVIFIIMIESQYGQEDAILARLTEHKALKNLRCVKNKKVHILPLYAVYSAGVRSYDGIKIVSRGLYPELYKE